MKKQTSVVAIVIAVIMSIVLFPLIFGTGIASGAVFSAESMMQEGREWELYDAFTEHGGEDWVYELLLSETGETIEIEQGVSVSIRELFPKEDVSTLMKELYEALIKGEHYSVKLPNQKLFVERKLMEYFDDTVEKEMKEQFGEAYELLDEQAKEAAVSEARKAYEAEVEKIVEKEIGTLETQLSETINQIYETEEYKEFKAIEAEYGYSLTDRTELCAVLNLSGYIVLGICCFFLLLLLICHLFRPSGFITAGIFSLLTGGLMKAGAVVLPKIAVTALSTEVESTQELPEVMLHIVEDVISWMMAGFDKVGMLGLGAGVILILIGILLKVMRGNLSL